MKPPAPGPVSVLSATHETKAAAMQASTALPPSASTCAPASAVSGCPAATAPRITGRLLRAGRYPRLAAVTRTSVVQREATLAAGAAASLAAALVWLGPPGSDLAEHAYQRTLFLNDGFALWNNFWYAGATASSPTARSTTRSRRCSGSACSPSRPSRPRRSRSRSSSRGSGGRPHAGRAGRSPSSGRGIVFSAAFPFALGAGARAARRSGRCRPAAPGGSPCSRR